jgi:hypothetical protein
MSFPGAPKDVTVIIYGFLGPRTWWRGDEIREAAAVARVCKDAHGSMAFYLNGCLQMAFHNLKDREKYYQDTAREDHRIHQGDIDDLEDELEHVFERTPAIELWAAIWPSLPRPIQTAERRFCPTFLLNLGNASVRDMVYSFVVWCDDIAKNATAAQLESADRAVALPPAL